MPVWKCTEICTDELYMEIVHGNRTWESYMEMYRVNRIPAMGNAFVGVDEIVHGNCTWKCTRQCIRQCTRQSYMEIVHGNRTWNCTRLDGKQIAVDPLGSTLRVYMEIVHGIVHAIVHAIVQGNQVVHGNCTWNCTCNCTRKS